MPHSDRRDRASIFLDGRSSDSFKSRPPARLVMLPEGGFLLLPTHTWVPPPVLQFACPRRHSFPSSIRNANQSHAALIYARGRRHFPSAVRLTFGYRAATNNALVEICFLSVSGRPTDALGDMLRLPRLRLIAHTQLACRAGLARFDSGAPSRGFGRKILHQRGPKEA